MNRSSINFKTFQPCAILPFSLLRRQRQPTEKYLHSQIWNGGTAIVGQRNQSSSAGLYLFGACLRSLPEILPNAKVSMVISTLILKIEGTLTATGTYPRHQVDPGHTATRNNAPVPALITLYSGDFPCGVQLKYSSPA